MLGFTKFIPPYANISDSDDILRGVNYASGASGIRLETAKHMVLSCVCILQLLDQNNCLRLKGDLNNSCVPFIFLYYFMKISFFLPNTLQTFFLKHGQLYI